MLESFPLPRLDRPTLSAGSPMLDFEERLFSPEFMRDLRYSVAVATARVGNREGPGRTEKRPCRDGPGRALDFTPWNKIMPDEIEQKIRQAQRRIDGTRSLGRGLLLWMPVALLACLVLLFDRALGLAIPEVALLGSAFLLAIILTALWTWLTPARRVEAACQLDQKLGLKDRLSTLAALSPEELDQPAAQALLHDSQMRVKTVDVASALPVRWPRRAWVSVLPVMIYLAIAMGVDPIPSSKQAIGKEATREEQERIQAEVKLLEQRAKERKKELVEEGGGEELTAINAEIEKTIAEMKKNAKGTVDQAAMKLSDLTQTLEQKRESTEHLDKIKRSLSGLSKEGDGPGQKLQQSLREGDFKKAAEAVASLKKELAEGKIDPEQKQKLAEQLKRLEDELKKAASLADRAKELQKGLSAEEAKKAMEQLAQQASDLKQLDQLAKSLGESSQNLRPSKDSSAGEAPSLAPPSSNSSDDLKKSLDDAERTLRDLARTDAERKTLAEMIDEVSECRGGVCRKSQAGQGEKGQGENGRGRGAGPRPEQEDKTGSRQTKVASGGTKGKSFITGKGDGPIFAGQSQEEIRKAVSAARLEADEAITHQPIPPDYRDHAREYFERLSDQKPTK
jgi:hypothetical protein